MVCIINKALKKTKEIIPFGWLQFLHWNSNKRASVKRLFYYCYREILLILKLQAYIVKV